MTSRTRSRQSAPWGQRVPEAARALEPGELTRSPLWVHAFARVPPPIRKRLTGCHRRQGANRGWPWRLPFAGLGHRRWGIHLKVIPLARLGKANPCAPWRSIPRCRPPAAAGVPCRSRRRGGSTPVDFLPGLKPEDSRAYAAGFLRTCSGCFRGLLSPSTPVCPTVRSVCRPADRMFLAALRSAFSV